MFISSKFVFYVAIFRLDVDKLRSMDDVSSKSATFVFHRVEYTVNLTTNDNQLTVEINDSETSDQWRNTFDSSC